MRLHEVETASGVTFNWRPFNVRDVMVEQNNIPFRGKPLKTAYMWRDIERRADRYGLSPKVPAPYPLPGLDLANLVATLAAEEGWVEDYTRATYRRWFEEGQPSGEDPNLSESLTEIGQDIERVLSEAQADRIERALTASTKEAIKLGVFGSPSFVIKSEVFWGDDRLNDAMAWTRHEKSN